MAVERRPISVSQLSELLGVEPTRLVGVERAARGSTGFVIVLEPDMTQTTGTFPQLSDKTTRKPTKKGKR